MINQQKEEAKFDCKTLIIEGECPSYLPKLHLTVEDHTYYLLPREYAKQLNGTCELQFKAGDSQNLITVGKNFLNRHHVGFDLEN